MRSLMQGLPKIKPAVRIVDAVHETLREAILNGSLGPGEQLSVPELSRQLDVSRSPVREAVLQLVAGGLAVEQPRKGVVVATVEIDDLLEIHEIREFLEALSARLCAERIDTAGLAELKHVLQRQRKHVEQGDAIGYFDTNAAFHQIIGAFARNERLRDILLSLEGQMRIGLRRVSSDAEQQRRGLAEHEKILAAISDRDPDRAEALMRGHIARTKARLAKTSERSRPRRSIEKSE